MGLLVACRAFWKALRDPIKGRAFIADEKVEEVEGDDGHLRLLAALQQRGRLIDFLQEEIEAFDDAQIGAAAREVHRGCRQCLDELVAPRPIVSEAEGGGIRVVRGYDASRFKLVGKLNGEPPYDGYVVHRGWVAHKLTLPKGHRLISGAVIAPAEIEVR